MRDDTNVTVRSIHPEETHLNAKRLRRWKIFKEFIKEGISLIDPSLNISEEKLDAYQVLLKSLFIDGKAMVVEDETQERVWDLLREIFFNEHWRRKSDAQGALVLPLFYNEWKSNVLEWEGPEMWQRLANVMAYIYGIKILSEERYIKVNDDELTRKVNIMDALIKIHKRRGSFPNGSLTARRILQEAEALRQLSSIEFKTVTSFHEIWDIEDLLIPNLFFPEEIISAYRGIIFASVMFGQGNMNAESWEQEVLGFMALRQICPKAWKRIDEILPHEEKWKAFHLFVKMEDIPPEKRAELRKEQKEMGEVITFPFPNNNK